MLEALFAFAEREQISDIIFPPGVTRLPAGCFAACKVARVVLPAGITKLDDACLEHVAVRDFVVPARDLKKAAWD